MTIEYDKVLTIKKYNTSNIICNRVFYEFTDINKFSSSSFESKYLNEFSKCFKKFQNYKVK